MTTNTCTNRPNTLNKMADIYDIYMNMCPIQKIRPFSDLRKEHEVHLQRRAYHSQVLLELYIMLEAIDMNKDKWISRPLIEVMYYNALVNQRLSELDLLHFQLSTAQCGIDCTDPKKLFNTCFILRNTFIYLRSVVPTDQLPMTSVGSDQITRQTEPYKTAIKCHDLIGAIADLLQTSHFTGQSSPELLKPVVGKLASCNQMLNELIVVKPSEKHLRDDGRFINIISK